MLSIGKKIYTSVHIVVTNVLKFTIKHRIYALTLELMTTIGPMYVIMLHVEKVLRDLTS